MKEYNEMTPIELNVLINKTKIDHENIKSKIKTLCDEVDIREIEINKNIESIKSVEDKYVELMSILIGKQ